MEDFSTQINELEERLADRTKEVEVMQSELKMVKEFRRKRGQMQKELDEVGIRFGVSLYFCVFISPCVKTYKIILVTKSGHIP